MHHNNKFSLLSSPKSSFQGHELRLMCTGTWDCPNVNSTSLGSTSKTTLMLFPDCTDDIIQWLLFCVHFFERRCDVVEVDMLDWIVLLEVIFQTIKAKSNLNICFRYAKWVLSQWIKNNASIGKTQKTVCLFLCVRNCLPNCFQEVQWDVEGPSLRVSASQKARSSWEMQTSNADSICQDPQDWQQHSAEHHIQVANNLSAWEKNLSPLGLSKLLGVPLSPGMENDTIWCLPFQRKPMSSPIDSLSTLQWWGR